MLPRRCDDITFTEIDESGEAVLFLPQEQRAVVVNATLAIVWLLCNGQRDANAIATELAASTKTSVCVDDVTRALDDLVAQGVLRA